MRRSAMFIFELIFIAASFVLCSAVCMRILVSSRMMSNDSAELAEAVTIAQSAAAHFRVGEEYIPADDSEFDVSVTKYDDGDITYGTISVEKNSVTVYTLEVAAMPEVLG